MRRTLISAAVAATAVVGLGLAAGPSGAGPTGKVTICHGTASESNPYVAISVSESALAKGHHVIGEAHGHNNNPDFVAADGEGCDAAPSTTTTTTTTTPDFEQ